MDANFEKAIKIFARYIPFPNMGEKETFVEWKNQLLLLVLGSFVILGFLAYVPSLLLSVKEELWFVAGIDTLVYLSVLVLAFSKKIPAKTKAISCIVIFYVLGVTLLIFLGKDGAGFNWLFLFPILSGFFYGYKGAANAALINILTLFALRVAAHLFSNPALLITQYSPEAWIVNSINFIVISTLISFALANIISNIHKSLQKEKELTVLLKENQEKLAAEKERAEESDRLKSTFLANMSHEIRTPMNAILGFSGLLTEKGITVEEMQQYNRLIQMSGEQLMQIIDDIIDISKIERNQMNVKPAPFPVYSTMKEVERIQQNRITSLEKKLTLKLDVPEELKNLVIHSDEFRFKQILNNLVGNAVKYTETGSITAGYRIEEKNNHVEFFVKDTGRGIPREAQEKIFDRFTQADNADFKEGTGLGLSITRGLLNLLGGTIRVESEPGVGSEFYFALPLVVNNAGTTKNNYQATPSDYTGKLIYIAEDDSFSLYYLMELLKPTKAEIIHAANGRELLELIRNKTPNLVLVDINMPVMNGFEAIREIRKTHPDVPVIAQTAYAMIEDKQKCMAIGCNAYITKPITRDEFFKTLNRLLLN